MQITLPETKVIFNKYNMIIYNLSILATIYIYIYTHIFLPLNIFGEDDVLFPFWVLDLFLRFQGGGSQLPPWDEG